MILTSLNSNVSFGCFYDAVLTSHKTYGYIVRLFLVGLKLLKTHFVIFNRSRTMLNEIEII